MKSNGGNGNVGDDEQKIKIQLMLNVFDKI